LLAALVLGGVGAFYYYLAWPAPRLDSGRIDSFAYGPEGSDLRELVIRERTDDPSTLDRILEHVNKAPLTTERPLSRTTGFVVILLRDDRLQYLLTPTDRGEAGRPGLVRFGEGGGGSQGYLRSPGLAAEIAALEARGDGVRPAD
jgi:hypothetical protein